MADGATVYNLVFVVCHPDDEAIWCGGLLAELSRIPGFRCHVLCLSGRDPGSRREAEFEMAKGIAGYAQGFVLGGKLRKAGEPLPGVGGTVEKALGEQLKLSPDTVDLLITHSPYGDEMLHPHHRQAHLELRAWTRGNGIPFGYFSCLPIPFFYHLGRLRKPARRGSFQILQLSRVFPALSWFRRLLDKQQRRLFIAPRYHIQFLVDLALKSRMIDCYESINLENHRRDFVTSSTPCESLYLLNEAGLAPFLPLLESMTSPQNPDLFREYSYRVRVPLFIRTRLAKLRGAD